MNLKSSRSSKFPSGGVKFKMTRGIIVHGKSTLEYGSDVPMQVVSGSRLQVSARHGTRSRCG